MLELCMSVNDLMKLREKLMIFIGSRRETVELEGKSIRDFLEFRMLLAHEDVVMSIEGREYYFLEAKSIDARC